MDEAVRAATESIRDLQVLKSVEGARKAEQLRKKGDAVKCCSSVPPDLATYDDAPDAWIDACKDGTLE